MASSPYIWDTVSKLINNVPLDVTIDIPVLTELNMYDNADLLTKLIAYKKARNMETTLKDIKKQLRGNRGQVFNKETLLNTGIPLILKAVYLNIPPQVIHDVFLPNILYNILQRKTSGKPLTIFDLYKLINNVTTLNYDDETKIIKRQLNRRTKGFDFYYNANGNTGSNLVFYKTPLDTIDVIFDAIINYLITYEYIYKVYLKTLDNDTSDIFQIPDNTLFEISNIPHAPFLAENVVNVSNKKITKDFALIVLVDNYLNYKFCLANNDKTTAFSNISHPLAQPTANFDGFIRSPLITTFNLAEKNFGRQKFEGFIKSLIIDTNRSIVFDWVVKAPVNCFQEVNMIEFFASVSNSPVVGKKRHLTGTSTPLLYYKQVSVIMDNEIKKYKNSNNIQQFIATNKLTLINNTFFINIYNNIFDTKKCVLITNRLANYDNDKKISKGNLTCIKNDIDINDDDIFIGKLGPGYQNNNIHTFIAVKNRKPNNKYDIIINLHLDTDDTHRLKQLELVYLLKYIIPKYPFFKDDNVNDIYIIGDLNMDCYEIIYNINMKVKSTLYKNRSFKVVLNNIRTHAKLTKQTALDNCIIITKNAIQTIVSKCDIYEPKVYISESRYMKSTGARTGARTAHAFTKLSDHSLIIIEDVDVNRNNIKYPLNTQISGKGSITSIT